MAKGEQYEARVEAWITPVLEQHQFELVDVEYVREVGVWYLRCWVKVKSDWRDNEFLLNNFGFKQNSSNR